MRSELAIYPGQRGSFSDSRPALPSATATRVQEMTGQEGSYCTSKLANIASGHGLCPGVAGDSVSRHATARSRVVLCFPPLPYGYGQKPQARRISGRRVRDRDGVRRRGWQFASYYADIAGSESRALDSCLSVVDCRAGRRNRIRTADPRGLNRALLGPGAGKRRRAGQLSTRRFRKSADGPVPRRHLCSGLRDAQHVGAVAARAAHRRLTRCDCRQSAVLDGVLPSARARHVRRTRRAVARASVDLRAELLCQDG
jgi:hypothetical protein